MDYRKPVTFGENWSPSRYKVLPYFAIEKEIIQSPQIEHILDFGCANGWNMSRFGQYGSSSIGMDVVPERVTLARHHGSVAIASGLDLPFEDESFDLIYVQHVLHHIGNVERALQEIHRCLRPNGVLFLIETVENNPIIRWGRRLYPSWMGDEINAPFYFDGLKGTLHAEGFRVERAEQYSILFWIWETLPDKFPFMEKFTPLFVLLEQLLMKVFHRQSAHCYYVAVKEGNLLRDE